MYKKFILIKNYSNKYVSNISDFFKGLLGADINIVDGTILGILHNYEHNDEIAETIESIMIDIEENLYVYVSKEYTDEERLKFDYGVMSQYMEKTNLKKNIYSERELIKELVLSGYKDNLYRVIFGKYADDLTIKNICLAFFENNMNTSKTANILYMHRNTLINKIDKIIEYTGYDLKNFLDAFIIYHLL